MHRPGAAPRFTAMLVFLDFEASSLAKASYPIEVAWVFEDGASESHLIRPAPGWTDWDPRAAAVHGIPLAELVADGTPHDAVARRMVAALAGHDLRASAPSWDGKWLSTLLRAAGLPRHALRLRDTEAAWADTAAAILAEREDGTAPPTVVAEIVAAVRAARAAEPPGHRALEDARREWRSWRGVADRARAWTVPPSDC
jgi:hypothetical protein